MSIPDMAKTLVVTDPQVPGDGSNDTATVSCLRLGSCASGDDMCVPSQSGEPDCNNATFALKRSMITIPIFNQTADQLYGRMLPNPGGDCKLVTDVGSYDYLQYNLTVTGAPVAIACNLSANANATDLSTTDGQTHWVPPPQPALGFPAALNASNAFCFGGAGGDLCLPNGTYSTQTGLLGFNSGQTSRFSMPVGANISFLSDGGARWVQPTDADGNTVHSNASTDAATVQGFMGHQAKLSDSGPLEVFVPGPDPPVVCLFTEPNYQGDVSCYGPGSGDLPPAVQNSTRSIQQHGSVSFWIYPTSYHAKDAQVFSSSLADLTSVQNGGPSFANSVKALWIPDPFQI